MMGDFKDVPTHTALEKIFNDVDDYVTKTLRVSQKVISGKSSPTNAGAVSGHVKIDDTLSYFNHNEKVLEKLTPLVRRQLLNNAIEAGLASALQTDDEVTIDTPIIGRDGCLTRL